ncbi:Rv0909 family putative TA system antitoxin [Streptomyces sp. NBC_01451]|uniref:Rv0909 family putative TA system antitoxin n=1 Tax=Streptomyces sp. NBC_01451 TaxID=2903872 RepID=UPI002E36643D|nr:Rv0909 family putative TA system antitoxin [Streptomyces sp. NBC_01451]
MGILDKFKDQMRGKTGQKVSDAAEKKVNEKTGNKYTSQVDAAQQRIEGSMGMDRDRDRPEQP